MTVIASQRKTDNKEGAKSIAVIAAEVISAMKLIHRVMCYRVWMGRRIHCFREARERNCFVFSKWQEATALCDSG